LFFPSPLSMASHGVKLEKRGPLFFFLKLLEPMMGHPFCCRPFPPRLANWWEDDVHQMTSVSVAPNLATHPMSGPPNLSLCSSLVSCVPLLSWIVHQTPRPRRLDYPPSRFSLSLDSVGQIEWKFFPRIESPRGRYFPGVLKILPICSTARLPRVPLLVFLPSPPCIWAGTNPRVVVFPLQQRGMFVNFQPDRNVVQIPWNFTCPHSLRFFPHDDFQ